MYLLNKRQNKVCSLHKDGTHRIYFNNRRKGTKLYIYHNKFDFVLNRLQSFGYKECDEIEFNNYFTILTK